MKNVIAIVGPTASGKTDLAIDLALELGTEIVSADSMQFYRGMEIGTGQPTPAQLARVKHHFIGHLAPDEYMSAGEYATAARDVIARINAAGRPVVVVGGSGLYIRALIDGLIDAPAADSEIRARLHARAAAGETPALYAELQRVDPDYAARIQPGDLRRIVRALEVHELTGRPLSALHAEQQARKSQTDVGGAGILPAGFPDLGRTRPDEFSDASPLSLPPPVIARSEACNEAISQTDDPASLSFPRRRESLEPVAPASPGTEPTTGPPPVIARSGVCDEAISSTDRLPPHDAPKHPLDAVQIALDWPRDELYRRIDQRVLHMFDTGLLDEVQRLLDTGYEPALQRLKSLAYRECIAHLRGQVPLDQTIATIQQNTRRYAKRQLSWFRGDERVKWIANMRDVTLRRLCEST